MRCYVLDNSCTKKRARYAVSSESCVFEEGHRLVDDD